MTKKICFFLFLLAGFFVSCETNPADELASTKKIVLLAGPKSHGPTVHEYLKTARLIKTMLAESSNVNNLTVEIHDKGWPDDPTTLNDANLILVISDGQDGPYGAPVPYMTPERMAIMEQQMKRGCGYAAIHFSTFADDEHGKKVLEWGGGYFDWQDEAGNRNWYSAIETLEGTVSLLAANHPIANGVMDFKLRDEYYYNIRFRPSDPGLTPLVAVPELGSEQAFGNVVAWAVERPDGGRGFSTTMGHFYDNWENAAFRKLILNAIVWSAGSEVPEEGVKVDFYTDGEVTEKLFNASIKGLIMTGNNHPAHAWQETTSVLREILEAEERIHIDVSTNIEHLGQYDLNDYDFLLMNYCNWEDSTGLSRTSKEAFSNYLKEGGGLLLIHFANGAFHPSLPGAEASDWPEYRQICRRVWDHDAGSGHDKYGPFIVKVADTNHELTNGLSDFETTDELYYRQSGDAPIHPLLVAQSKDTGTEEPLAWIYTYGKGRVFQTLLGHDVKSLEAEALRELLRRAAVQVSEGEKH